jgi:hypothetical protein
VESLEVGRQMVAARRPAGGAPLVRAVAEARLAGVPREVLDRLMRGGPSGTAVQRAVEVMTDLSLLGYPPEPAAGLVRTLLAQDPDGLERLPGCLEALRRDYGLGRGETAEALNRGLASSDSLGKAFDRTVEDQRRRGQRRHDGAADRGDGSEGPGKSGWAPGRLRARSVPATIRR